MMIDEISNIKYLFLNDISEPDTNVLKLTLQEGITSNNTSKIDIGDGKVIEGAREINKNDSVPTYQVTFDEYITFTITNESFSKGHIENNDFLSFSVFRSSSYIEYMKKLMFMKELISGPIKHYSICCVDHIVDVISESEPKIEKSANNKL